MHRETASTLTGAINPSCHQQERSVCHSASFRCCLQIVSVFASLVYRAATNLRAIGADLERTCGHCRTIRFPGEFDAAHHSLDSRQWAVCLKRQAALIISAGYVP